MKVNAINSYSNNVTYGHTAVPYPEYENAYKDNKDSFDSEVPAFIKKISSLFAPHVTKEAAQIKSNIDNIYSGKQEDVSFTANETKKQLLSVLA